MTVEYSCRDGSGFPVLFADPADVTLRWVLDREHAPTAMPPLAEAVRRAGQAGSERAYAESGLRVPSTVRRPPPEANGYEYAVDEPMPPAERSELAAGLRRLTEAHGGSSAVWLRHCLPRVEEGCQWLARAGPDTPFRALADRRASVWSHTAVAGLIARRDLQAVAECCVPLFGEHATFVAYQLAQGHANETVAADAELWSIARMAAGGAEEKRAFDRFLATYGARAMSWSIDHPTAIERADLVEAEIRALRRLGNAGFDVQRQAAERRRALAATVADRLGPGPERARFERRLGRLDSFVAVREARARWQLVATGAVRGAVLRRARLLVDRGAFDSVDDVFFLTPQEYDHPAPDLRTVIADRRLAHAKWRTVTPPTVIGNASLASLAPDDPATGGGLRGWAGAPGVATGPVRVIVDLGDADRLRPGDILVTTMTAPPWTALFAVAAAVVADAGDPLSHVAIAAREYGIPCVVGTNVATVVLRDGESVTVDGAAGTVTRAT